MLFSRSFSKSRSVQATANAAREWNSAIKSHAKEGNFDEAYDMLFKAEEAGFAANANTYGALVSYNMRAKRYSSAITIFEEMRKRKLVGDLATSNNAINACARLGNWQKAVMIFEDMRQLKLIADVYSYSSVISACEEGRKWGKALQIFEGMKKDRLQPNLVVYNVLLSACEKSQQWKTALKLFAEMKKNGIKPDVITYNAIISACDKGFQWKHAIDFLSQMKKDNIKPDVITYSSAISALSKGKCWEEAINLLFEMKTHDVKPNVIAYNSCISACANARKSEEAIFLLKEMTTNGLQPNEFSYNSAISACEDSDNAMGLLSEMKVKKISPTAITYTSLMQVLVSTERLEEGFMVLEEMYQDLELTKNSYPTHYILLTACRKVGDRRANDLQSKIIELKLAPPKAEVLFMINKQEHKYVNGKEHSKAVNLALEKLYKKVRENTDYEPRLDALPLDFVQKKSSLKGFEHKAVHSLKYHAEKKALATLLLNDSSELTMRVNFGVCVDCHAFLSHASKLLGRKITVLEPSKPHHFHPERCI